MTGKPRTIIMLTLSVICLSISGIFFYKYADVVKKQLRGRSQSRAGVVAHSAGADKPGPGIKKDATPPIPRPQRPPYPDRPTVALLDFDVDRDTYLGEQTAGVLSELIRQLLNDDAAYQFLDRGDIARVREEHELGLFLGASQIDRLELGRWLKADLIVSGGFVDVGESTQALDLAVIDTVTAERVTKQLIPFTRPLNDPASISSDQVETLAEAVRTMLAEAHHKLLNARDARVVSLLFFRNVSLNDRLDYQEFTLAERLSELAEADRGVRLVRLHDPTLAMQEQELMLIGLSADNAEAWQTAADFYMWGLIQERDAMGQPPADSADVTIDPQDVVVDLTLVLWHGLGEPVTITESGPARDIDKAVERASTRAWEVVKGDLPDQLSLSSRDEMVKLLIQPTEKLQMRIGDAPDSWPVRRFMLYLNRLQLAWFLDADNGYLADMSLGLYPATGVDQPWSYLGRMHNQIDRRVRRFGLYKYGRNGRLLKNQHAYFNERLIECKIALLADMAEPVDNTYAFISGNAFGTNRDFRQAFGMPKLRLPPDMPDDVRLTIHEHVADELARLGERVARALAGAEVSDEQRERYRATGFIHLSSDVIELIKQLGHADDAARVRAFEAWWPVIEKRWRGLVETANNNPNPYYQIEIDKISVFFARAGLADRYNRLYGRLSAEAEDGGERTRPRVIPTADDTESLKRFVADLRERNVLANPITPVEVHQSNEYVVKEDPPGAGQPREPEHANAPLIDPGTVPLAWHPDQYPGYNPVVDLRPGYDPPRGLKVLDIQRYPDRFFAVLESSGQGFQGLPIHGPRGLLAFDPIDLSFGPVLPGLPKTISVKDIAYRHGRFWLATEQDGLVRYNPQTNQYDTFTGEHGLPSRRLASVIAADNYLIVSSEAGDRSLVSRPDDPTPTINDIVLPASGSLFHSVRNMALIGSHKPVWFDLDAKRSVAVTDWIDRNVPGADANEQFVWASAVGEHFWIMLADRLVRVQADLTRFDVFALPIPPLPVEDLVIHDDGRYIWFAYAWPVTEPIRIGNKVTRTEHVIPPKMRSEVVVWLPGDDRALARWQVDGEVKAINSKDGELYLVCQEDAHDILAYNRDGILRMAGKMADAEYVGVSHTDSHDGIDGPERAAFTGDMTLLKTWIDSGQGGANRSGEAGWTPMMYAVRGGHAEAVRVLLDAGADPNRETAGIPAIAPLLLATIMDRPDLMELLHDHGARLDCVSPLYGMPAHAAVRYRAYDALRWLIDHGAPVDKTWVFFENDAAREYNLPAARWLRPLLMAIQQEDDTAFDMLLDAGAQTSGRDNTIRELSPLTYAVQYDQPRMLSRLIEVGADVNQSYEGVTALGAALRDGKIEAAELLLDAGADPAYDPPELILFAIGTGSAPLVEKIIQAGVHIDTPFFDDGTMRLWVNIRSYNGCTTPAHWAVTHGQIELYDWMLGKGVNMDQPVGEISQGDLIASALVNTGHYERAIDLAVRGYSIDIPPYPNGTNALMSAADRGKTDLVRLLLGMGADPGIKNDHGKRASDLTDNQEIHEMLELSE